MLFGCLGAAGVVVIGPKYAARTARMERMSETRERVKAAKDLGVSATEVRKVKPGAPAGTLPAATLPRGTSQSGTSQSGGASAVDLPGGPAFGSASGAIAAPAFGSVAGAADEKGPIEPYVEADFQSAPRLGWLLALMVALMLAGTGGMILSRRRQVV
jgi:hypothetical protein